MQNLTQRTDRRSDDGQHENQELCFDGVERLESRILLAGNINISVSASGNVNINGDGDSNSLVIELDGSGDVRFTGTPGTTINGGAAPLVMIGSNGNVGNLRINLRGGNDAVSIVDPIIVNGNASLVGGSGMDQFSLNNLNVQGNLAIRTGSQGDLVDVFESVVGGRTRVTTGSGLDTVNMKLAAEKSVTVSTGSDDDSVEFLADSFVASGNLSIRTGNGGDAVELHGTNLLNGNLVISTASGEDLVGIYCIADIDGTARITTGTDNDLVAMVQALVLRDLIVNTGSGNDGLSATFLAGDDAIINTGSGDDAVILGAVMDQLIMNTGSGNDFVGLNTVTSGFSTIVLGSGNNELSAGVGTLMNQGTVIGGFGNDIVRIGPLALFSLSTVLVDTVQDPSATAAASIAALNGLFDLAWVARGGNLGDLVCI